jgi:branched-chain amino acid transport system substrate-binding protein
MGKDWMLGVQLGSHYMGKKFAGSTLLILVFLLLFVPSCISGPSGNGATIKIGAVYPLTGSQGGNGKDIQNGLLLAIDIINNKFNLNLPLARSEGIPSLDNAKLEVIFADSEGSDTIAQTEAQKLIEQDHVAALIGCYQSAVTAAASQVAESEGIPFLSDTSTAPSLTQRRYQWFFRTTPDDVTFVRNYLQFLAEIQPSTETKFNKIGIVAENSIFGSEFDGYVRQYAPNMGYQIVANIAYSSTANNVDNEVQRLISAAPDIIMQASYSQDAVLYMQTYKRFGFSPQAILTDDAGFNAPQFIQKLGGDSNYIFTRDLWTKDWADKNPLSDSVNQMFKSRYQSDMTSDSARALTGLFVLADAIQRAGSINPAKIRAALLSTDLSKDSLIMAWQGVKFDPQTHQNTLANGLISQIIDQEYRTVWPGNLAIVKPVWPMPGWNARK